MKKFVLDTNLYIRAIRDARAALELRSFQEAYAPATWLSSVVLHELLVGASTVAKRAAIQESIAGPLERVGRVVTPNHGAWSAAGQAIAEMARREKRNLRSISRSLIHDFVLAASCRQAGMVLITDNVADFRTIRRFLSFQFEEPWPK